MRKSRFAVVLLIGLAACKPKPKPAAVCEAPTLPKSIGSFLQYQPLTGLVNPIIGTGNGGNVIPGPAVPHGAVKLSPDTNEPPNSITAYGYGDTAIQGFSHSHMEGPGGSANGYSNILVMATRGPIATTEAGYQSTFSHSTEVVQPGYYAVNLETPNALAELTATRLCGVHRYTFSGTDPGNILIDVAHTRGSFMNGQVEVVGNSEIRGFGVYEVEPFISIAVQNLPDNPPGGTTGVRTVYFDAHFTEPFDSFGTWENGTPNPGARAAQEGSVGAWGAWQTPPPTIDMQVCISAISTDQAAQNYAEEVENVDFDTVQAAASTAWNQMLNRVQVTGGTQAQQQMFYTALYHALLQPADYTEDCQFWSGENGIGTVLPASGWEYYSDDWCMWDTYRTTHPLQLLVEPERASDIVHSIMVGYEQGGWMNRCSWDATGYSRVMVGIPFAPIIANAYVQGFRNYDVPTAWAGLMKAATQDDPNALPPGFCGYMNKGTPPEYVANGYVSHECDVSQAASMTLEYAFEDWSLSQMAAAIGDSTDAQRLQGMAGNYRNVFNPAVGFMQGKHLDGGWVEPFDPTSGTDFTEADSWIYTWLVPHDQAGLIDLIGGPTAYVNKLNVFFSGGYDQQGNEPSFEIPYLYDYAGAPAQTQAQVRSILTQSYGDDQNGLPGNDDSGAMSSWYVWSALGLYPISPGDGTLLIGSPIFDSATIYLEPNFYSGRTFTIETVGNGPSAMYIQSATLNGAPLTKPWITFADVVNGGTLTLQMGTTASMWGSDPASVPPSMSTQ